MLASSDFMQFPYVHYSVHYSLHFFRFRVPQLVLELLQVLEACPHLGSFRGLSGSAFQLYIIFYGQRLLAMCQFAIRSKHINLLCSIVPWAMESEMAARRQMIPTWPLLGTTWKAFAWGYARQILDSKIKSSTKNVRYLTEVTIIGFGSLLSKRSALLTTPSMKARELPRAVSREYSWLTARASSMSRWRATNGNLHILLQSSSSDSWLQ